MLLQHALMRSQLLRSPIFHKGVRRVHRKVEEVRRGEKLYDPEDFTGLHIDSMPMSYSVNGAGTDEYAEPNSFDMKKFVKHYREELQDQFRDLRKK